MTTQEVINLISALGFPIALIVMGTLFAMAKIWPWYVKRQERRSGQEDERHKAFMLEMARSTDALNVIVKTITAQYDTITRKLDDIERNTRTRR